MNQAINERMLIQAIRQRMLDDIHTKKEAQAVINNNVYGGHGGGDDGMHGGGDGLPSPGGIHAGMHDAAPTAGDDRDYFVDILRENLDPENPGKGWTKKVHRYAQAKEKAGKDPKKKVKG